MLHVSHGREILRAEATRHSHSPIRQWIGGVAAETWLMEVNHHVVWLRHYLLSLLTAANCDAEPGERSFSLTRCQSQVDRLTELIHRLQEETDRLTHTQTHTHTNRHVYWHIQDTKWITTQRREKKAWRPVLKSRCVQFKTLQRGFLLGGFCQKKKSLWEESKKSLKIIIEGCWWFLQHSRLVPNAPWGAATVRPINAGIEWKLESPRVERPTVLWRINIFNQRANQASKN